MNSSLSDPFSQKLAKLSDDVSRIAVRLAQLGEEYAEPQQIESMVADNASELTAERVEAVIRARRLRGRYFFDDLFADPVWDMMLDLLSAEILCRRVTITDLCGAAAVPATTALRWIKVMEQHRMLIRRPDRHDSRRIYVELSPQASDTLRCYFTEVRRSGPTSTIAVLKTS